VGIAANYAALFPVAFEIPFLLLGVLILSGALVGSLICGWACPFGFLQDLLAKITPKKLTLPGWTGHLRFVVLVGLVIALPMIFGARGIPFEEQSVSICRTCPAGALEAGLPFSIASVWSGKAWLMSIFKTLLLAGFVVSAIVIYRPWCRLFCPLGGWLALFNRWSLFHLQFKGQACVECNLCRTRCPANVKLDLNANAINCVRCLECTRCGAVQPALALPNSKK